MYANPAAFSGITSLYTAMPVNEGMLHIPADQLDIVDLDPNASEQLDALGKKQVLQVSPQHIDFKKGTPVITNVSKFVLPIGTPPDAEPLVNPQTHQKAGQPIVDWEGNPIGETGVVFENLTDNQVVAAQSGDGVIIMNQVTEEQAKELYKLITDSGGNLRQLTVVEIKELLAFAAEELGLVDRYNSDLGFIGSKMTSAREGDALTVQLGDVTLGFVKRDDRDIAMAVYTDKPALFDGTQSTNQFMPNGAFIVKAGNDVFAIQPDIAAQTYRHSNGSRPI